MTRTPLILKMYLMLGLMANFGTVGGETAFNSFCLLTNQWLYQLYAKWKRLPQRPHFGILRVSSICSHHLCGSWGGDMNVAWLCNWNWGPTFTTNNGEQANAAMDEKVFLLQSVWQNVVGCDNQYFSPSTPGRAAVQGVRKPRASLLLPDLTHCR